MKTGLWENVGEKTIPSFGIFRVTGQRTTETGQLILQGDVPDGKPGLHLVNKNIAARPGKVTAYWKDFESIHPLRYKLDGEAESLTVGDHIGYVASQSEASPNGDGWTVVRPDEEKSGVVLVRRGAALTLILVETTGDHDQDDTQDCYILSGAKGEEEKIDDPAGGEDPYVKIECYNRFGDLSAEQQAIAAYVVNGWEILAASCEED